MPSLRIKVGAVLDPAALKAFEPLERSSERARGTIQRNFNAAGQAAGAAARPVLTEWQKVERELEKEANRILKAREKAEKAATSAAKKEAAEATRIDKKKTAELAKEADRRDAIVRRSSEMAGREAQRAAAAEIRAATNAARVIERERKRSGLDKPWYARDVGAMTGVTGHGGAIGIGRRAGLRVGRGLAAAYGYGGAALSGALGIGGELLHGMGVETNFSTLVQKSQEQRQTATKISNAGYIPGKNALESPDDILRQAREVGNATGTETSQALDALRAFVAKTGDLKLGQQSLKGMAVLAKATGSSMEDMADASAEVANHMGDVPDKAKVVDLVMRQIAGQGKLGAVEVKDLARQMAKVAATANFFKGGAAANIGTLGVFAQEAKLEGGATSSAMAATSVARFATALSTPTTMKAWKAKGFANGAFTDASHSTLADPLTIVMNALKASSGANGKGLSSQDELKKLFGSAQAARAVTGWQAVYNRAGGGDAGQKAVVEEFERLKAAQLDSEEVTRAFNATLKGSESQATILNNKLEEVAGTITSSVLPAFLKVAPDIEQGLTSFGNLLAQVTGAKRDKAVEALDSVTGGGLQGDIRRLKSGAGKISGAGGDTTVYSGEALAVAKAHWAQRNAAISELETQVKNEKHEAKGGLTGAGAALTEGVEKYSGAGWIMGKLGIKDTKTRTGEAEKLASSDAARLEQEKGEQREATKALGDILLAINTGNQAIVTAIAANPPPAQGGSAPPNSPAPE